MRWSWSSTCSTSRAISRAHRHAAKVRADFAGGVRSGVNGTPTFFVNGARHDGPYDAVSLLAAIEAAAAEKVR